MVLVQRYSPFDHDNHAEAIPAYYRPDRVTRDLDRIERTLLIAYIRRYTNRLHTRERMATIHEFPSRRKRGCLVMRCPFANTTARSGTLRTIEGFRRSTATSRPGRSSLPVR